jgi:hypothetical protein
LRFTFDSLSAGSVAVLVARGSPVTGSGGEAGSEPGHFGDGLQGPVRRVGLLALVQIPRPFIGSGVVGTGCDSIIGQRLKSSGMRWTVNGASAIATLRCHQATCPDDRIWQQRRNQTGSA